MSDGSVRIEVSERETPVFGGTAFGAVGSYERLHGTVFGELTRPISRMPVSSTSTELRATGTVMPDTWRRCARITNANC